MPEGFGGFIAGRGAQGFNTLGGNIRTLEQAAMEGESNPLAGLAVTAANRARFTQPPAPDAVSVGETPEEERIVMQQGQVVESAGATATAAAVVPPSTGKRVAFYVAKNDLFSVVVEESPDWEPTEGYKPLKLPAAEIVEHVQPLLRALGVKTIDRTAGDLEEAYEPEERVEAPTPLRRRRSS